MRSEEKSRSQSYSRRSCLTIPCIIIVFLGSVYSCALESQRVALYQGRIVFALDSANVDTIGVDLSQNGGMILYAQDDGGAFTDTAYFEGDSEGFFSGALFVTVSATIRALRLEKPIRIVIHEYAIDTFVTVSVYLKSHDTEIGATEIGLLFAHPTQSDFPSETDQKIIRETDDNVR